MSFESFDMNLIRFLIAAWETGGGRSEVRRLWGSRRERSLTVPCICITSHRSVSDGHTHFEQTMS